MSRIVSRRPQSSEYACDAALEKMFQQVPGNDLLVVLRDQWPEFFDLIRSVGTDQVDEIHPPYRWTIRQVVAHLAEAERIFGYRILRFAAGDPAPLPGWDENAYAESKYGLGGKLNRLVEEIELQRQTNLLLLRRLRPSAWDRQGQADGRSLTVRACGWLLAAHFNHHVKILSQRINSGV